MHGRVIYKEHLYINKASIWYRETVNNIEALIYFALLVFIAPRKGPTQSNIWDFMQIMKNKKRSPLFAEIHIFNNINPN